MAPEVRTAGLILCGGASQRMGQDKALLEVEHEDRPVTLLERTLRVLEPRCDELLLACGNGRRYAGYAEARPSRVPVRTVLDVFPEAGPLAGLHAGLSGSNATWFFLTACDLPNVVVELFDALLERAREASLEACFLATTEGGARRLHPALGVVSRAALEPVARTLAEGGRRLDAYHGAGLAVGALEEAELPEALRARDVALNLNTLDDVRRASVPREVAG